MLPPIEARIGPLTAGAYKVCVGNVSPGANEATLREFFAFAGPVADIQLSSDVAGGTQAGSVSFLTAQGAETACLLDGALIVDRPINIHAPAAEAPQPALARLAAREEEASILADDELTPATAHLEDHGGAHRLMGADGLPGAMPPAAGADADEHEPTPAGEAIAALLAAGYKLGQRALDFLNDFEERNGRPAASAYEVIRERALSAQAAVRAKVAEVRTYIRTYIRTYMRRSHAAPAAT